MHRAQSQDRNRVRLLSEDLANKIAAGEVVERPASIVKELVENAIDAGASRVEIRLEAGGRDLVEVTDDGAGMSFEDARLSLERHATSKLSGADDLFAIQTLGFRGEALPSIAAVSKLEILTCLNGELSGTLVRVEGGRLVEHSEAGAPSGTRVRVEDLFADVPARRKFLRRPETEVGHASETLLRIALAHPEVGFHMTNGPRTLFNSPGGPGLAERVAAAVGRDVAPHLYPVAGAGQVKVTGLLGSPEVNRAGNRGIHLFVNRRFIRDRSLNHAVVKAYGDLVDRGRSPIVVLFIETPPHAVDVNVHPQKTEVRFQDARGVYEAVLSAVGRTIRSSPWAGGAKRYVIAAEADAGPGPTSHSPRPAADGFADHKARVLDALGRFGSARAKERGPSLAREEEHAADLPFSRGATGSEGYFGALAVIGQLGASYILCEGAEGLVVVDQHAAHERLAFERLREARAKKRMTVQSLLLPRTISLPAGQAEKLEEHIDVLEAAGFDVSTMGGGDIALRGVPSVIAEADVAKVLSDLLDELSSLGGQSSFDRVVEGALATVACHSVVRSGQALSREECEALLGSLDSAGVKGSCPHGRPVAFTITSQEIERRFGRR